MLVDRDAIAPSSTGQRPEPRGPERAGGQLSAPSSTAPEPTCHRSPIDHPPTHLVAAMSARYTQSKAETAKHLDILKGMLKRPENKVGTSTRARAGPLRALSRARLFAALTH